MYDGFLPGIRRDAVDAATRLINAKTKREQVEHRASMHAYLKALHLYLLCREGEPVQPGITKGVGMCVQDGAAIERIVEFLGPNAAEEFGFAQEVSS